MNKINLKVMGINSKVLPKIFVDGQVIKCKKNEFGSYQTQIETEKSEIEIIITRKLELRAKLWWLYALISFVVSLFGILEPFYDRKCIAIDCRFKVKINAENNINLRFNSLKSNGKAVVIETENEFEEIKNEYNVDKIAKKRFIILLIIKLLVWIALAIVIAMLIAKSL